MSLKIRARLGTAAHFCKVVHLILRTVPIGTEGVLGFSDELGGRLGSSVYLGGVEA